MSKRALAITLVAITLLPWILFELPLWFMKTFMGGFATFNNDYQRWLSTNLTPNYQGFWWIVLVGAIVAIIMFVFSAHNNVPVDIVDKVGVCASGLLLGISVFMIGTMLINNKDTERAYNQATTFVVTDINNPPQTLSHLLEGATNGDHQRCLKIGKHDVPSCIAQGQLPNDGWEVRSASYAGAVKVMGQASGDSNQADLLQDTVTHIYPKHDEHVAEADAKSSGYWTGIRDGKETISPMEGVVEWNGHDNPTTCNFEGDHELNRALRGHHDNDLQNLLIEQYAPLWFEDSDIYGYCDHVNGNQPVVVFPMRHSIAYNHRSVDMPAGVVLMRGSPSGMPQFEFKATVKAGEVIGPVYALSIAEQQREVNDWAAGRGFQGNFGFEIASATTQAGNNSEFLLRSRADGRTYWVTPLTPKSSNSQQIIAYMVVPADEVSPDHLNEAKVYVLNSNDPGVVNINNFERDAKQLVATKYNPSFFTTGGDLEEFVPTGNGAWRTYGVNNGQPYFEIELSPDGKTPPKYEPVSTQFIADSPTTNPITSTPNGTIVTGDAACGKSIDQLTQQELVNCLGSITDELKRRQNEGGTK